MAQQESQLCVGYILHKDKSPILQGCDTKKEQEAWVKQLKKDGYNPIPMSMEEGNKFLMREGKHLEPKPKKLTQEDRWWNWAIGN